MTLLSVSRIHKRVRPDFVLRDISFTQRKNEKLAIAGESGSGKTTLLKIIAGLVQPDNGRVLIKGERVRGPNEVLVPGNPLVAYLSQNFELPKFLRVEQALEYANKLDDQEARTLFKLCRIDHLLHRNTDELSGGERQRIAVCRLLLGKPLLLLLDEPFSHLDPSHKDMLKHVIHDVGAHLRMTCILISHDPGDALSWADRIIVMRAGRIVQAGRPSTVFNDPVDEYTAGMFGKYSVIAPEFQRLFGRWDKKRSKKSWLIRPAALKLVSRGGVRGKVEQTNFLGGMFQLHVRINEGPVLIVNHASGGVSVGEAVNVAYASVS